MGRPLFAGDVTPANHAIRAVLGEPVASRLEQVVGITMGQALMTRLATQLVGGGLTLGFGADSSFGGVSMSEYVDVQLGALGVV